MPGRAQPAQEPRPRAEPAQGTPARRGAAKQAAEQAESRRLQVGSGDRSQRIRTYNFPQGRITDHRINLTLYRLPEVITGDLDELIDTLTRENQADQLQSLSSAG